MECKINQQIDYLDLPRLIAAQRQLVLDRIRQISQSHVVHPGLTIFKVSPLS
jgi:histone acetyltransferase